MGFAAGSISGAGRSESNLGWADVGLIGYEENLRALQNALSALQQSAREGRIIERLDLAVSFAEINELMGLDTVTQMEQRFDSAAIRSEIRSGSQMMRVTASDPRVMAGLGPAIPAQSFGRLRLAQTAGEDGRDRPCRDMGPVV